jgi:hypothetical protein
VNVVDVDKVVKQGTTDEGALYVCVGEDVNLEALPDPCGASFPEGEPTWQVLIKPPGSSPTLTPPHGNTTTTLSGLSLPGYYFVKAKCCTGIGDVIPVIAVDVGSIEINYSGSNWDDVTDQNIVVLKGTKYDFKAIKTPAGASWPSGPPVWSGAASGTGETINVTFATVGSQTLTAKCCSESTGKQVTIEVKEPTPYQIGFGGDHTLYKAPTGWDGWADGVDPSGEITDPVYDSDTSDNCDVCVTKNSGSVSLTNVKLKVDEALTYTTQIDIDTTGTEDWDESTGVSFSGTTSTATTLSITGNIIDEVKRYNATFQTTWKYKVPSGTDTWYTIGTVNHTVYVTYGAPEEGGAAAGVNLTVQRIDKLCEWADGESTRQGVADKINDNLSLPFEGAATHDDWGLMCTSCGLKGECDEHAAFMVRCLDLIGVSDSVAYETYASDDTTVTNKDDKYVSGDKYYLKYDADGDHEVDNNFEGSVKVPINDSLTSFHYYTVTPKVDASTECSLWRALGPDPDTAGGPSPGSENWKQVWVHTPTGLWLDAWIGETHLAGFEGYDSCP